MCDRFAASQPWGTAAAHQAAHPELWTPELIEATASWTQVIHFIVRVQEDLLKGAAGAEVSVEAAAAVRSNARAAGPPQIRHRRRRRRESPNKTTTHRLGPGHGGIRRGLVCCACRASRDRRARAVRLVARAQPPVLPRRSSTYALALSRLSSAALTSSTVVVENCCGLLTS